MSGTDELQKAFPDLFRHAFLEKLPIGVASFSEESTLLYANDAFLATFHTLERNETILGMEFSRLLMMIVEEHEIAGEEVLQDPEAWIARLVRLRDNGEGVEVARLADGRFVEISFQDAEEGRFLVTTQDVTERVRQKLFIEDLVEGAGDGFAVWSQADRLIMANATFAERFAGRGRALEPGRSYADVIRILAESGTLALESKKSWLDERMRARRSPFSKTVLSFSDGAHFVVVDRRTRDGGIVTILADVTRLVETEQSLQQKMGELEYTISELEFSRASLEGQGIQLVELAENLQIAQKKAEDAAAHAEKMQAVAEHSETRIRIMLDTMADGLITIDHDGVVTLANPAAAQMFERPIDDIVGKPVGDLMTPKSAPVGANLNSLFAKTAISRDDCKADIVGTRGGGAVFPIEARCAFWAEKTASEVIVNFSDISERKAFEEKLRELAMTDPLTGVANRRYFYDQTDHELQRAVRYGHHLSLIYADLDHFKSVNDNFGHDVGDEALKLFADAALELVRDSDVVGRLGGEEFAILLPQTSEEGAFRLAERLRQKVAAIPLDAGGRPVLLTVSIGVHEWTVLEETMEEALKKADHALLEAKRGGRNMVKSSRGG